MQQRKYAKFNYVPQKKLHNYRFYEHFTTGNQLVCSREMTVSTAAHASHNYNRNNYYLRPHLDARWFFLYRGSSTTTVEVKIIFIYPRFVDK